MGKAYDFINILDHKKITDRLHVTVCEDHDENVYYIVDTNEDYNELINLAIQIINLDKDLDDSQVCEELGVKEIVFSDEHTTCSDCEKIIKTSPDSYHWMPDYYVGDRFIVCSVCFVENYYLEDYIDELVNNPRKAVNGLVNEDQLRKLGFKELDGEYQSGRYGRNDNPVNIYNNLSESYEDILFFISSVGQFHTDYKVFVRGRISSEEEEIS